MTTTLFILLCITLFACVVYLVEVEFYGWSTIFVVGSLVGLYFLDTTRYNSISIEVVLYFVAAYVLCGIVWSFVRWVLFVLRLKEEFDERAFRYKKAHNLDVNQPIPKDRRVLFFNSFSHRSRWRPSYGEPGKRPSANDYKSKITAWISFWPFSVVGFVLRDLVKRFLTFLFNKFRRSYQSILEKILNNEEFK